MSDLAHDALYQACQRLLRLARENKIHTPHDAALEVKQLLADAAVAVELAGGPYSPAPLPCILPGPEPIEAQPVERRKDW